jgi:hypothetical protein
MLLYNWAFEQTGRRKGFTGTHTHTHTLYNTHTHTHTHTRCIIGSLSRLVNKKASKVCVYVSVCENRREGGGKREREREREGEGEGGRDRESVCV